MRNPKFKGSGIIVDNHITTNHSIAEREMCVKCFCLRYGHTDGKCFLGFYLRDALFGSVGLSKFNYLYFRHSQDEMDDKNAFY